MPDDATIDAGTAVLLGIVQGITEFLPISSDGHLAIAALALGEIAMPLSMVVLLHLGTLLSTLLVFHADALTLLRALVAAVRTPSILRETAEGRTLVAIVAASVPTAAIGLGLRDAVEAWARVPWIVAACLVGTALAVASTRVTASRAAAAELTIGQAVLVGLAQGLAVLPGLSRSGSTIAAAMALGVSAPAAFRFSFLASLPAVAGAVLLELRHPGEILDTLGPGALAGAATSFAVGLGALLGLRGLVARGRFWIFAVYLVPLALGLAAWGAGR